MTQRRLHTDPPDQLCPSDADAHGAPADYAPGESSGDVQWLAITFRYAQDEALAWSREQSQECTAGPCRVPRHRLGEDSGNQ